MSPVYNEMKWTVYVRVVMKSEIRGIELIARIIGQNDVGEESSRSPTLLKTVDEQGVKCGIVPMQPLQETQDYTDANEPSFIDNNETVLNVKLVSASVDVGDIVIDAGFLSGVGPQPIGTGFVLHVDPPSVELEFMPEYEAAFEDDWMNGWRIQSMIDQFLS
jgi:hypothetical protein